MNTNQTITLTDTHCHLADAAFSANLPQILAQAKVQGVARFIVPCADACDFAAVAALQAYPEIQTAFGIHPWFAEVAAEADFAALECRLKTSPTAWTGEIGLDFLRAQDAPSREIQMQVFRRQLQLAQSLGRRVIIHNVKATAAIVEAVKACRFTQGGIAHAFSGSLEEAKSLIRCGFKIGIGSLLFNPNAKKVRQAAALIDWRDFVLETDSPFMLANETNTPAKVRQIAEIVAGLRGVSVEEVAAQTERNVEALLNNNAV